MSFEALNSAAAQLHRHFSDVAPVSWTKRRRSKRVFNDDYFADCLVALARSGGATSSSTAAVDAKQQTKLSSSYNCTLSGQDFSSRRTLRRHRASQPPTAADEDRKPSNLTSTATSDCTSGSHRIHQCSICAKIFATGQALGGHMRKHYGGAISRNGGRKSRMNSSDGGAVDMAPIAHNLVLKLPLPPS